MAQMGAPDMRAPIAVALAWPDRMPTPVERLDLVKLGQMTFEAPDPDRFPALDLARAALRAGGCRPAVLNAANEVAVAAFLARRIPFLQIAAIVAETLEIMPMHPVTTLPEIMAADAEARRLADLAIDRRQAA